MDPAERSRLLSQLQRRLHAALQPPLQHLFEALDARLFDLAERSRIASHQQVFFEGLRECRRKRNDIEHDFLEHVDEALRPARDAAHAPSRTGLSLVGNEELEETLTLSAMADRAAARMPHAVDALDLRLGRLLGQVPDPHTPGRLSPQALGLAFRAACQRLDVGIEVRLVAYNAFGQHVLEALEPIYADLNRELVAAGVLPAIAVTPPRIGPVPVPPRREPEDAHATAPRARGAPPRSFANDRPAGPSPAHLAEARRHAESQQGLLQELRGLVRPSPDAGNDLTTAAHAADEALRAAAEAVQALSSQLVLTALDRLSHAEVQPRHLKSQLVETSHRLGADPRARMHPHDEETVDLVALVFDFVRQDPVVPKPLQALLARLQVPFLRSALTDPDCMQVADHPARRLLDDLGEVALGWCPSIDPEKQMLERIGGLVEGLLQPQPGRAGFERALDELRDFLEQGKHRAELAEQRAVEAALGRERLRIARARVASMLERRLGRYTPLPWIRQVLRGPWANHLVLLWLRHGEAGEAFREALRFADELLWCDEHGAGSHDEARLRLDEDALVEQLRAGLATVAYHDREVERLAGELRQFIASLRKRQPAPDFLYEIDPKLGSADFAQHWHEADLQDQPDAASVDPQLLAQLRTLLPGAWFEFGGEGGGERAKLSWTSPFTGRQLFVNRNGLRVGERSPEQLADEIEKGMARMLENSRLLQRALQALVTRLRAQGTPRTA